ncbi:MAG: hypothetical protein K2L54_04000, partial [Clostridiales bacterium]|nr:hypothetical protein [Clostridiales bacterium]
YTLVYHAVGLKNNKQEPADVDMFTALNSQKVLKELADGDGLDSDAPAESVEKEADVTRSNDGQAEADDCPPADGDATKVAEMTNATEQTEHNDDPPSDGASDVAEKQENEDGNRKD